MSGTAAGSPSERKIHMYCQKCGKEITAGSVFCTWCGARQDFPVSQPENIQQSSPVQETPAQESAAPVTQPEAPATTMTMERPEEAHTPQAETSTPAEAVSAEAPQESASEPAQYNMSETTAAPGAEAPKVDFSGEVKLADKPEKPRKYYTGAHLAICLAAAGIMAAAAGIFAGLYFSVIM